MALTKVGLSLGGTNAALTDPNADRILFWDDSASAFTFLTAGSGLDLTGTTLTVADNSITGAKIALGSDAAGDIMYHNGTDYIRLPKGTADQVLTMNDGATAPNWEAAGGGGAADDYFASSGLSSKDQGTGLHIKTGDSGGTASSAGNEFIIEGGSGNHGMSILGSGDGGSYIYLGDGAAPSRAGISYSHGDDHLVFRSGDATRMTIKSTGDTHLLGTAKLHFGDGTDTYFYQRADDQFSLYVGNRHLFQVRGGGVYFGFHEGTNTGTFASGPALPNNPSNALANGVHIHDGDVNDYGAALSFSNSSVAHGITGQYDTTVFGDIKRRSGGGTGGGLEVRGVTDSNSNSTALRLHGTVGTSVNTSTTAGGYGAVVVLARKANGTDTQACASNENIFSVDNNTNTRFIIKGNGDMYGDTSFSGIGDTYDDAQLIRALDIVKHEHGVKGYIQDKWDNFIQYNEQTLLDAGILGDTLENKGLLSYTGLQKFHSGAIWQLYSKMKDQEEEIKALKEQMVALQAGD